MLGSKEYYLNLYNLSDVKQQAKYRNFLCIGPINSISLSPIRDEKSVSIYEHEREGNVHILTFSNAVRKENTRLWGNKTKVFSIKKSIPKGFRIMRSRETPQEMEFIPNFQPPNYANFSYTAGTVYEQFYRDFYPPSFCYGNTYNILSKKTNEENEIDNLEIEKQQLLAEKEELENEIRLMRLDLDTIQKN